MTLHIFLHCARVSQIVLFWLQEQSSPLHTGTNLFEQGPEFADSAGTLGSGLSVGVVWFFIIPFISSLFLTQPGSPHPSMKLRISHRVVRWIAWRHSSSVVLGKSGQQHFDHLRPCLCQIRPLIGISSDVEKPNRLPSLVSSLFHALPLLRASRHCLWRIPVSVTYVPCQKFPVANSNGCTHSCIPDPKTIKI